jgi:hypothetical protein
LIASAVCTVCSYSAFAADGDANARESTAQESLKTMAGDAVLPGAFGRELPLTARKRRPNVIALFIDDLAYGDIGAFGCPDIPTPHIDSLARDGVRCTNGYTICPVCSPSRTALMTGRYPQEFGVNGNTDRGASIPDDHPILAEFMRDAGYFTGMVGRWDIGSERQGPLDRGFMEVGRRSFIRAEKRASPKGPTYYQQDGVYWTERQGNEMADFVTRHKNEPFFLYFCPLAIHSPVQEAPQKYLDRDGAGGENLHGPGIDPGCLRHRSGRGGKDTAGKVRWKEPVALHAGAQIRGRSRGVVLALAGKRQTFVARDTQGEVAVDEM